MSEIDKLETIIQEQAKQMQELVLNMGALTQEVRALVTTTNNSLTYQKEYMNTIDEKVNATEINVQMLQISDSRQDEKLNNLKTFTEDNFNNLRMFTEDKFSTLQSNIDEIKNNQSKNAEGKRTVINGIIVGVIVSLVGVVVTLALKS